MLRGTIDTVLSCGPKRGARCKYGRSETRYMIKLEGEAIKRRVYEDWTQLDKRGCNSPSGWAPVPLVVIIKGEKYNLTREHISRLDQIDWKQEGYRWTPLAA